MSRANRTMPLPASAEVYARSSVERHAATEAGVARNPVAVEERRLELGRFLRLKRCALSPESVGIRRSQKRRSQGLLREEVAERAGLSTTWYTWLEQGRDIRASGALLDRLANALRLDDAERAHLFQLARPDLNGDVERELSVDVPASLRSWLMGLAPHPAYVHNGIWQVLAWNDAAVNLLGDFGAMAERDRNILTLMFLSPHWRALLIDWEQLAVTAAAQFRAQTARFAGNALLAELIADLLERSEEFARIWESRAVNFSAIRTKRFADPQLGIRELDYASLEPTGVADDLSVVIYTPSGSSAHGAPDARHSRSGSAQLLTAPRFQRQRYSTN